MLEGHVGEPARALETRGGRCGLLSTAVGGLDRALADRLRASWPVEPTREVCVVRAIFFAWCVAGGLLGCDSSSRSESSQLALPCPTFSHARGIYSEPLTLTLSCGAPDVVIIYTLNGASPSPEVGTEYTTPLNIESTSVIRAVAVKKDGPSVHSETVTHTYLFPRDIIKQGPTPPEGWPSPRDAPSRHDQDYVYGMLPARKIGATDDELARALQALPSMSLVTDLTHWFDQDTGIYHNAAGRGRDWERPVSVEWIDPTGAEVGFQINAGVRIRGGGSRRGENPKHAFRLYFRKVYGAGKLRYPLFQDEGVAVFDDIGLRTAQNNAWSFKHNFEYTFLRDVFARDCQRDAGQPYTRSRFCHLFLNGLYWGLYQTQEHSEASYAAEYFGGSKEDYDVVKAVGLPGHGWITATDGNLKTWRQTWKILQSIAAGTNPAQRDALFARLQGYSPTGEKHPDYARLLDVESLIDYMLINLYIGSEDGPIPARRGNRKTRNRFSIGDRSGALGFRFFLHDSEKSLEHVEVDQTGPFEAGHLFEFSNPQWFHQQLTAVPEYREHFARRAHALLTSGGALTPKVSSARIRRRITELEPAIVAESARWGRKGPPYTKRDWENAVEKLLWIVRERSAVVLKQLQNAQRYAAGSPRDPLVDAPLYPRVLPVSLTPEGGSFPAKQTVLVPAEGQGDVYFTTDGSDPRAADGTIGPTASRVPRGTAREVTLQTGWTTLCARRRVGEQWSFLTTEGYACGATPADRGNVQVSEIMYNPRAPNVAESDGGSYKRSDFEFIELRNTSREAVDLSRCSFLLGVRYTVPQQAQSLLEPGARVVIVKNRNAFARRYGGEIKILGEYRGKLSNAGETLRIVDATGRNLSLLTFDDAAPWPVECDGGGRSLCRPSAVAETNLSQPGSWRASKRVDGSPGASEAAD